MGINANSLQKLYVAYFNRPADPAGLAYWEKLLDDKKATLDDVAKSFAADKEYAATFKDLTQNQIVNKIYMNLFGHGADNDGLLYWVGRLNATEARDKLTIDQVVVNISAGARNEDKVAFDSKVAASESFTDKVSKTPGGVAAYSGDVANAIAKAFITSVTDAATLAAATAPAKLTAVVESVQGVADPLLKASNDAAAAFNAANTTVAQKVADAATAAAKVTTDDAAEEAAFAKAALTDAAALQVVTDEAAAKADAAATAKTDAIAAVAAATKERDDALKAGDEAAYNAAKAKLAAANDKVDFTTANAALTAADAAAAKAKSDAAVADDAAAVKATETLTKSIADAATAATAASTAATAAADAAAKFSAAAKATTQNSDDVAAAAAVTSATKAVADAANAQGVVTVINSIVSSATAAAAATVAAEEATAKATAATAALAAVTSAVTAKAAQDAAAAQVTAAAAAKEKADAALAVATAYDAAAKATTVTTDDAAAAAALKAANAAVETAKAAVAAAATAKAEADLKPKLFEAKTATLTAGIDTFVGGLGNDTVTSTIDGALSLLDNLDGGAGTGDALNVSDTKAIAVSTSTTVVGFENVSLISASTVAGNLSKWTDLKTLAVTEVGGTGAGLTVGTGVDVTLADSNQAANTIGITGGAAVNVTTAGQTTGTINLSGATGAVVVNSNLANNGTGGNINVSGGTTVNVTQTQSNAVNTTATNSQVTVMGTAVTTAVTATMTAAATASATVAGVNLNTINVTDVNAGTDKAGKLASVTASNFSTLSITGNALTTLNVAGGTSNIIIDNSGLTTPTNKTLAVNINGQTGGTLDDADIYTTLNVTTSGANSTLTNITFGGLTTLNVAGTKGLTLNGTAGMTKVATITVTGSAGLTASTLDGNKALTSVNTAGTTGTSTVTIDGSKATFTGGAGVDNVTLVTNNVTKAVDLGAGDDSLTIGALTTTVALKGGAGTDTLSIAASAAATAGADTTFAGLVSGFERLTVTGATNQTINLANLGGYNHVTTSGGNGLNLSGMATGATLVLTGAGTAYTVNGSGFSAGTADVLNLSLTGDLTAASIDFASKGVTATDIETINVSVVDTNTSPAGTKFASVDLLGDYAKSIVVTANAGVDLGTLESTKLTSIDASGISKGGFTATTGALAAAATIKGSAAGLNTVDFSAATKAVTYIGGTGNDVIAATNAKDNVFTLGNGANSINTGGAAGNGNNTVTAGTGNDTIKLGSGNNTIDVGAGDNTVEVGNGTNTVTAAGGLQTIKVGTGANIVTIGSDTTDADVITVGAPASANNYTTITGLAKGDKVDVANQGVEVWKGGSATLAKITLDPSTALFADFIAASSAGDGSTDGIFSWFQFGGNTYIIEDKSAGASFVAGTDVIVKLTGAVDLSTATLGDHVITLG